MFSANSCEPTLPKSIQIKREQPQQKQKQQPAASFLNQFSSSLSSPKKQLFDTKALIDNTSFSTFDSPIIDHSSQVSSTIMSASVNNNNTSERQQTNIPDNNNNAMTSPQHEIISIKERVPTKAIRIERDYSLGDGITKFMTEYPVELTGKISPEQFKHTIEEINKYMDYADRLSWKIVLENIIETLSIYIWPIFFSTHYQRVMTRLISFIEKENSTVYNPQWLSISDPVKSAFLFIEINFYD